jgi:hypothetical protein
MSRGEDHIYTLDWQQYEYEENRDLLKKLRVEQKRKATQGCEEHQHIVFCKLARCEYAGFPKRIHYEKIDALALAEATRVLPFDIRKKIASYYNQMYTYAIRVPKSLLNQVVYKYSVQLSEYLVMHALHTPFMNLMRGYCPCCGEPVVNSSYFYWGYHRRRPLRTNKYGLTMMRTCQICVYSNLSINDDGMKTWREDCVYSMKSYTTHPFVLC